MLTLPARGDRRMSENLRRQVPSDDAPGPGGLLGLELEFSARSQPGGPVHFGSLIHHLALDGSALDPGDPNAYRCSWGGVITCDGAEAEIATPPVRTRPGFAGELQTWAEAGEAALRCAVPRGIELHGYSAHFSAAMPARLNDAVCRLYTETFAADLMLMMDRADSPGLLVRPRPERTELCGEFVDGETLPAVAAFAAGTAMACAAAVPRRSAPISLPPKLDVRLAQAVQRYGWYVDRRAYGTDLHADSRRALLPRASGGTISAQSHLELAWAAARQALAEHAAVSDLQAAEAMVTGALPLPTEQGPPEGPARSQPCPDILVPAGGSTVAEGLASCLCAHVRPGFTLLPVAATWDFTVFEASSPARSAYVCVPRNSLPGFVDELRLGALDDVIAAYLARSSRRRVLAAHQQTRRVGLYDQLGSPAGLLAPERDPQTGHPEPRQNAKHAVARPGKRNRQEPAPAKGAPRFTRKAVAIAVAAAILLVAAGVGVAVAGAVPGHGHGRPGNGSVALALHPGVLSFPAVPISATDTRSVIMTDKGRSPVTVAQISILGPGRHDFSAGMQSNLGSADGSSQAIQLAAHPVPCLRPLRTGESCQFQVEFSPSAVGPDTADLRIYFTFGLRPRDIRLTGTGVATTAGLTLSPATLPMAPARTPITEQITAAGGTAPYQYWLTSGSLPAGLSLDARTGVMSGTPTTTGSYTFTITATDSSPRPHSGSRQYTLQVTPASAALTLAPAALPAAQAGTLVTQQITATGGTAPYTFSVTSGALPPGLSLNSSTGVVSGTPNTAGSYPFTITATDSSASSKTGSKAYTLQITSAKVVLTLAPTTLPDGCTGGATPYQETITATGGTAPYTFSVTSGALPPGLSLSSNGVIGPSISSNVQSYSFTITATDSSQAPNTGSQAYTINVINSC